MANAVTPRREIEDRFINEWGLLANAWGVSPLLGRIHGIPTPFNYVLQRVANDMARQRQQPGLYTAEELREVAEAL